MKRNNLILAVCVVLVASVSLAGEDNPNTKNPHSDPSKDQKTDLHQWSYTTKQRTDDLDSTKATSSKDQTSYFENKRKATDLHIKNIQQLNSFANQYVTERQVATINSRLYNVGAKGEPAPSEPDLELYETHIKLFCSPLSGYETKLFKDCNTTTPLILQHADLKPMVLDNPRLSAEMVPIVRNWIDNFLTSLINPNLPNYIRDPNLMADTTHKAQYVRRLRAQIPTSAAANSLNIMLANRIPLDPKAEDSPSLASSLADEVTGRHLNTTWHDAVAQTTDGIDISREQLKVLALISYQLHEMNGRVERLELLNSALVTSMTNQQELLEEMLKAAKSGKK